MNFFKKTEWIISLTLLLAAVSCSEMINETPQSELTTDNFFTNTNEAESALVGAYAPLNNDDLFKIYFWVFLNNASDVAGIDPEEGNGEIIASTNLDWSAENPFLTGHWDDFYQIITRANLVIDKISNMDNISTEKQDQFIAEAKFLRGLAYYFLVRLHGDIPLITSSEDVRTEVARTPKQEVFNQITSDFQDAVPKLPKENDPGRATWGAAKTALASVHLWLENWQQASDNAKEVIDSGKYALFDNYIDAFRPEHKNGKEHIFSVQFEPVSGGLGSAFALWTYPRELGVGTGGGWGTTEPAEWHYNSYMNGDERFEEGFFTQGSNFSGEQFTFAPHIHLFEPLDGTTDYYETGVNHNVFRYAEVLLMYAEAQNELGNQAEAKTYLDMVRSRADIPGYSGSMSKSAVRDAIFQERRWELPYEGKRWFDLVRRGEDYFMSNLAKDNTVTDLEKTDMLWPIPTKERDLNPALTQNPGY